MPPQSYSFLVAGHTYGAHGGQNIGLYPSFLSALKREMENKPHLLFLTGDIVRNSMNESWNKTTQELDQFNIPYYFIMGNHDLSEYSKKLFVEKFGGTFFAFDYANDKFIVLDSQIAWGSITQEQINLIKSELNNAHKGQNIFIFFHELLWASDNPDYSNTRHNWGSYSHLFRSNFWRDIFPLLKSHPDNQIYIFAGDVGGNRGAIPAFYDQINNVYLIASGMGEVGEENFLRVSVYKGRVDFDLIPINPDKTLPSLLHYQHIKNIP